MSQQILPFYLLCDESGSTVGGPVDAINESLRQPHLEIGGNPFVVPDRVPGFTTLPTDVVSA